MRHVILPQRIDGRPADSDHSPDSISLHVVAWR
jgi:hypothetical protein